MTLEEFIASLPASQRDLARLYLPVLTRWTTEAGWDTVRKALYVQSQITWYRAVRKRMTTKERLADDERARLWVKAMARSKTERVLRERVFMQAIVAQLLVALVKNL